MAKAKKRRMNNLEILLEEKRPEDSFIRRLGTMIVDLAMPETARKKHVMLHKACEDLLSLPETRNSGLWDSVQIGERKFNLQFNIKKFPDSLNANPRGLEAGRRVSLGSGMFHLRLAEHSPAEYSDGMTLEEVVRESNKTFQTIREGFSLRVNQCQDEYEISMHAQGNNPILEEFVSFEVRPGHNARMLSPKVIIEGVKYPYHDVGQKSRALSSDEALRLSEVIRDTHEVAKSILETV